MLSGNLSADGSLNEQILMPHQAAASHTKLRPARRHSDGQQTELPLESDPIPSSPPPKIGCPSLADELKAFREFGKETRCFDTTVPGPDGTPVSVPTFVNEFWTAGQRQANRLHEVSYRACFKPQLPRFFIERLTRPGDIVYDPFMGRGTTPVEAALLGRVPMGCDINPLSITLTRPRLRPPIPDEVRKRLERIPFHQPDEEPEDLLAFYHPDTLREISSLRRYLRSRQTESALDPIDEWIAMVALNRLTGHSAGFFSVYTLPPNQAVSVKSQRRINERRQQTPPRRNVPTLILKKSRYLLSECDGSLRQTLAEVSAHSLLLTSPADATPQLAGNSVDLVVTSPPFLNVVDYATDNWLRCWFLALDAKSVKLTIPSRLDTWQEAMTAVFRELHRTLKPGGHVAFEVGEVHGGETRLETAVVPAGLHAGLSPRLILINDQQFTKTANCWGVDNNAKGTNTNRIVLFQKR